MLMHTWIEPTRPDDDHWPQDIPQGPAGTAWMLRIVPPSELHQMAAYDRSVYFCCWGLLAPTTHNTSPQKWQIAPDGTIALYLDTALVLPASDPRGRHALVSIGAVLENIVQAIHAYGLQATVTRNNAAITQIRPQSHELVHVLTITPSGAMHATLDESRLLRMKHRRTNRAEYDGQPLPPALAATITTLAAGFPQLTTSVLTNKLVMRAVAQFQQQADNYVVSRNPTFREELGQWLRRNEDTTSPRGMNGAQFGQPTNELYAHVRGEAPVTPSTLKAFAKAGQQGISSSSALLVISSTHASPDELRARIDAGRLYEQIALAAVEHDFCTAMHAALTETFYPEIALFSAGFTRAVLQNTQLVPTAICRIGRPHAASDQFRPHSARPMIDDLLLS